MKGSNQWDIFTRVLDVIQNEEIGNQCINFMSNHNRYKQIVNAPVKIDLNT